MTNSFTAGLLTLFYFGLGVSTPTLSQDKLLISGQIKPSNVQQFMAPWSANWNHTIKWLRPEGDTVEQGDLIVVLDPSDIESRIEQEESKLLLAMEKAKEKTLDLEKKIIEAEHELKKYELERQKVIAKAKIPKNFRSNYDYDYLQFERKKYDTLLEQAKLKLANAEKSLEDEKKKNEISKQQINAELSKLNAQRDSMQLFAERNGTVLHATHPWNGSKISAGSTVQTSMKLASIPNKGDERVQAWVNEVDRKKVQEEQTVKLTLDAYPSSYFWGKIAKISQQAESKREWGSASYYEMDIEISAAPSKRLVPGMSVRVQTGYEKPSDLQPAANELISASNTNRIVESSGELTSSQTINIGPPLVKNQWQFKITYLAPESSEVKEGKTLIKFDTTALNRRLMDTTAKFKTGKKSLETITLTNERTIREFVLSLEEAKMQEEKAERKWKLSKGVDASVDAMELKLDYQLAQNKTRQLTRVLEKMEEISKAKQAIAENNVTKLESEIKEIKANIGKMTVKAPKSGMVVYKTDNKGEKVSVGDSAWHGQQLISLPSLEDLGVKVEVLEAFAGKVSIGNKVEVRLDANPDRVFLGKVAELGSVFRRKSFQQPNMIFDVVVELEDADLDIMRPGMTASVKIITEAMGLKHAKVADNQLDQQ